MKYTDIWNTIKATHRAEVTVSKENAATVIQGVKRTKCVENGVLKAMDQFPFPKITYRVEKLSEKIVKITFELPYDFRI
jgi:hypothetical protein